MCITSLGICRDELMRELEQTSLGYSKHRLPLTHAQDDLGETMSRVDSFYITHASTTKKWLCGYACLSLCCWPLAQDLKVRFYQYDCIAIYSTRLT